ncbi:MAG TPA: hypothetical protein QGF08_06245 [Candidatus Marinimicrobia bacterium]|jgi:hypothetical protein|nr:hypothetical protein [Candidatus Neomarinimicrobiota bacterium]HJM70463.1 hypothetical protein [Candidatus Neomarinimicrobiota bacterium]|tara:strand:+ start:117 stop:515 length:399 start_codon:yes stop_codon:yes gene_type:complete
MKRLWTILPLLFVFSCDDQQESENMYQYSGYDSLGVQIIEGSFFFEYGDSSSISGAWDFNVIGSPENIGPQTGEGEYIGTVENNQLLINLNPEWADNNVHLDGAIDGNKITGDWVYSGFAGSMNHGTFSAEK